uniref:Uncharacterized protein n=1 Tax=Timema bartmani TaxID=61472 RepID=A0A7R9F3L0_9NEOP|nr:unnamed protein product [Timema bartmani]
MNPTSAILGGLNRLAQNIIGKHDVVLNLLARVFSSSFVHTVPSLVFLFAVGIFLYDHNPQVNFLKRKWTKNLAKVIVCWFFVHVSLQVWLLFQQMVYILVRNYWQLPSHYVDTSAILWDFLWGVKHQPAEPWIPADFVYLCVTGACAVALLASVGRPRVVVKLLTTLATLGVNNLLRVTNNYLHRMKALLPHSLSQLGKPTPSFPTKLAYPLGRVPMKLAKKNYIQKLLSYVHHEHREFYDEVVKWPISDVQHEDDD